MSEVAGVSRAPSLYQAMAGGGTALLVILHFIFKSVPELSFFDFGVFNWGLDTNIRVIL